MFIYSEMFVCLLDKKKTNKKNKKTQKTQKKTTQNQTNKQNEMISVIYLLIRKKISRNDS